MKRFILIIGLATLFSSCDANKTCQDARIEIELSYDLEISSLMLEDPIDWERVNFLHREKAREIWSLNCR